MNTKQTQIIKKVQKSNRPITTLEGKGTIWETNWEEVEILDKGKNIVKRKFKENVAII